MELNSGEVGRFQISITADSNGSIYEVILDTKKGGVVSRTQTDEAYYTELPTDVYISRWNSDGSESI